VTPHQLRDTLNRRTMRGTSTIAVEVGTTTPVLRRQAAATAERNAKGWEDDAACKGMSARLFFAERGSNLTEAKKVCAGCPVREECFDYAIAAREQFGCWGGVCFGTRSASSASRRRPWQDIA